MKSSHFCGLKRVLFNLEHEETLFFAKNVTRKNFEFLEQNRGLTVTSLENCDFWPYEKFPFLWSKKYGGPQRQYTNIYHITAFYILLHKHIHWLCEYIYQYNKIYTSTTICVPVQKC